MPPAPMGGAPAGAGAGMPGDPMGGMGGPPMGGGPMPQSEPPIIPKNADVWEVLDAILNHKPMEHDKKKKAEKQTDAQGPAVNTPPPGMPIPGLMG